ncbi:MAG: GIY-YIG nuclease family protein [Nitrospirales bacterium]|nr:GIY-YIG nuclease family protein [Nitrospirales bacterium]
MKTEFRQIIADVETKYDKLTKSNAFPCGAVPMRWREKPGIYVLHEGERPLYVGRTNDIRTRLQNHTRRSHNQATLAFLLARHETDKLRATYQTKGSREDLLKNDPDFAVAFDKARARIKRMDVKAIEEADPLRQAVLEIYAAFVSGAKFNDFDNH